MTKWSKRAFLAAFPLSLLFGCGNSDQLQRQVSRLEKQLISVRADADRMEERLAQIELENRKSDAVRTESHSRDAATNRVERPRLKVIHVNPDASPADETATDTSVPVDPSSKRPVIRGTGDRVIKMFDAESAAKRGAKPIAAAGPTTGS